MSTLHTPAIAAARSHSDDFNRMLDEIMPRLRSYSLLLTRNKHLAEDLSQETALRALRGRKQFAMGTNFAAWMYRILRNEFISMKRREKRLPAYINDIPDTFLARDGEQESVTLFREVMELTDKLIL